MQTCLRRVLQTAVFQNSRYWEGFASVRYNSNKAAVCRVNRITYVRVYPTTVVLPNGSTISVRYREPRKIIKLPLDLSTLTAAEREDRLRKRKPKTKIVIEEDIEDDFDVDRYSHLWKKK
ncbi:39S ribosomal protein L55, mitochondrial-like [Gigantopelta aegis]|uniref:39S ribosomal protein L55, mitochondrial-like n=1 Tax=Gigantopelta aegis TaxID=1735272 RepID=UPI001B88A356|nr:39S ribosomal protein L55, mitochondrial-like [Gigantopelta aegis]